MLNGVAPVIIFKIYPKHIKYDARWKEAGGNMPEGKKETEEVELADWQALNEDAKLSYYFPYPIPIYLDEKFTKVAVDEADQDITFDIDYTGGKQFESPMSNDVTISLQATKDNVVMSLLLASISQIIPLLSGQRYSITLFYDSIFILNGSLKGISQRTVPGTNIKSIVLTISQRMNQKKDDKNSSQSETAHEDGGENYQR